MNRCACGRPLRLSQRSDRCIVCAIGVKCLRARSLRGRSVLNNYERAWIDRRNGRRVIWGKDLPSFWRHPEFLGRAS